ncbi:MAG: hypothetical protein KC535_01965 [Nanoarchaeota archaeon]|nr:hypothetical protein [Nanoarchaeota archaeon]
MNTENFLKNELIISATYAGDVDQLREEHPQLDQIVNLSTTKYLYVSFDPFRYFALLTKAALPEPFTEMLDRFIDNYQGRRISFLDYHFYDRQDDFFSWCNADWHRLGTYTNFDSLEEDLNDYQEYYLEKKGKHLPSRVLSRKHYDDALLYTKIDHMAAQETDGEFKKQFKEVFSDYFLKQYMHFSRGKKTLAKYYLINYKKFNADYHFQELLKGLTNKLQAFVENNILPVPEQFPKKSSYPFDLFDLYADAMYASHYNDLGLTTLTYQNMDRFEKELVTRRA